MPRYDDEFPFSFVPPPTHASAHGAGGPAHASPLHGRLGALLSLGLLVALWRRLWRPLLALGGLGLLVAACALSIAPAALSGAPRAPLLDTLRAFVPTPLATATGTPTPAPTAAPTLTPPPPTATAWPSAADPCVDAADNLIVYVDGAPRRLPDYIHWLALINGVDHRRLHLAYGCAPERQRDWLSRHRP